MDDLRDQRIGDFIVLERLNQDEISAVYRAFQPSVNRQVALRVIPFGDEPARRGQFLAHFLDEARTVATLEHIHILPIYGYGIVDDHLAYMATRLVTGGSVADLIEQAPISPERVTELATQIAHGLSHAHQRGILHRNLKPSKILLDEPGNAYLTDFEISKLAAISFDLSTSGNVLGTPLYVSPEQLRGQAQDRRSDTYSFAAILYHLLTGHPPYTLGEGIRAFIAQHDRPPAPPRQYNPAIPQEMETALMQALAPDPADRLPTPLDLAEAFNRALGRRVTRSSPSISVSPHSHPTATRFRKRVALPILAGLILLAGALAVFVVDHGHRLPVDRPAPQVIAGERGSPEAVAPSPEEVARAQAALGENGFIAFIACDTSDEAQVSRTQAVLTTAAEYGVRVEIYDSAMDRYRQISLLERARLDGAQAIILCALDSDILNPALQGIQEARLPLAFITPYFPTFGGVMIDNNDYELGLQVGRYTGELINAQLGGEADVVILHYPDLPISNRRADGLEDGILETAPNADIVGRFLGLTEENAQESIAELIEADVEFDVIAAMNDNSALGAIAALEAAGVANDSVMITSINGEPQTLDYLSDHKWIYATLALNREAGARLAVEAIVRLLAGSPAPEVIDVPTGRLYTRESIDEVTATAS